MNKVIEWFKRNFALTKKQSLDDAPAPTDTATPQDVLDFKKGQD